jgi:hypothetical protein
MINIEGLNKAEILAALWNKSKTQGISFLANNGSNYMTKEQAEEHLKEDTYFDYLNGRVMKVDLSGNEFNPALYDRDNGQGSALKAIESIL